MFCLFLNLPDNSPPAFRKTQRKNKAISTRHRTGMKMASNAMKTETPSSNVEKSGLPPPAVARDKMAGGKDPGWSEADLRASRRWQGFLGAGARRAQATDVETGRISVLKGRDIYRQTGFLIICPVSFQNSLQCVHHRFSSLFLDIVQNDGDEGIDHSRAHAQLGKAFGQRRCCG